MEIQVRQQYPLVYTFLILTKNQKEIIANIPIEATDADLSEFLRDMANALDKANEE